MRGCVTLLGGCLLAVAIIGDAAGQDPPRLYRYRDDQGKDVLVTGRESVPSRYLDRARPVGRSGGYGVLAAEPDAGTTAAVPSTRPIYRYVAADGRVAYSDRGEDVAGSTEVEVIDLSEPDALQGRGALIEQELTAREQALAAEPACRQARALSDGKGWKALAQRHPGVLAIGGLMLALLAVTPWMLRRMHAAAWSRALAFSLQVLGLLAVVMFGIGEARHSYRMLSHIAEPCERAAAGDGPAARGPQAILRKLDRVQRLREAMKRLEGERAVALQRGTEGR